MAKTKFEVYKDGKGHYRWRLLSQNGEPVASAGEGYTEKRGAMNAVKKLKDWANTNNVVDIEKAKEEAMKNKAKSGAKKSTKPATKKAATAPKKAAQPARKATAGKAKKATKKAAKKVETKPESKITPVI